MAERESAATILKILSGVQSGVDVALLDGDYMLGSGDDDDIQLVDVSLRPGHARLSIHSGKIEIAGVAGQLRTGNGVVLEPGGEPQAIEPLDIVSAGTTRFALGPRTANWTTITDAEGDAVGYAPVPRAKPAASAGTVRRRGLLAAIPVLVVLALIVAGIGLAPIYSGQQGTTPADVARSDLELVREAIAPFGFAPRLKVRQELDGVVYVTGFVDTPVERRAAMAAIGETDIPARVRIAVLEVMRNEVANLIDAEKVDIDFTLSEEGELTLTGVILDAARAQAVTAMVSERMPGAATVVSQIRTAPGLLADARALADRSRIHPLVMLRLDGELIEASGLITADKIDSWVGFLQAYSSQFAPFIPLRSFVQFQNADGTINPLPEDGGGLYLGSGAEQRDVPLDIERLRAGSFDLSSVFIGHELGSTPAVAAAGSAAEGPPAAGAGQAILREERGRIQLASILGMASGAERGDGAPNASGAPGAPGAPGASGTGETGETAGASRTGTPVGSAITLLKSGTAGETDRAGIGEGGGMAVSVRRIDTTPDGGEGGTAQAGGTAAAAAVRGAPGVGVEAAKGSGEGGRMAAAADSERGTGRDADANEAAERGEGETGEREARNSLGAMARRLIERWQQDALDEDDPAGAALRQAMDALRNHRLGAPGQSSPPIPERYAPLLARAPDRGVSERCWLDSRLTVDTMDGVLFWLDLLSVSSGLSILDFDERQQPLILEAALNPERSAACAARARQGEVQSAYLYETSRNGGFVRYITRDLSVFPIDVAGVSIAGTRYIQTRSGAKMREGSAPDEGSRLLVVGQLGVAVERQNGYSAFIFGPEVNWQIR